MENTTRVNRGIVIVLLIMWGLLTIRIDAPWFGHHDANGVEFMTMARNYALYGAPELGFLQLRNYEIPARPENYHFYFRHPPMISWVLGLAGVPFMLTEASSRFVMICATMISIASLYVLSRRLLGQRRALFVVILYGITPMIAYFGRMPNHEPLVMGFLMPFITIYAQYLRYPTRARWSTLAILAILCMWTAWAAFFFFMALILFGVLYRLEFNFKKLLTQWIHSRDLIGIGIIVVLATIAVPLFYESQYSGAIQQLLNALVFRTSDVGGSLGASTFTLLEYIAQQLIHMVTMMTLFVVVMGFIGIKPLNKESRLTRAIVWGMLVGGISFLVFFRNASYIHDYYKYYLMPSFAILACIGMLWAWKLRRSWWAKPAMLGLLLVSMGYALLIFVATYISSNQPTQLAIANAIRQNSTTEDLILTNLTSQSPAIEFYAERRIKYEIIPEKALEQVNEADQPIIYVYCLDPMTDELSQFRSLMVADGTCYIIWLNEKAS